KRAHSYEEPAYDVYPLRQPAAQAGTSSANSEGEGRLGMLSAPQTLSSFAALVRGQTGSQWVQMVGDRDRPVQRVAIACGAGGEFLKDAIRAHADVLVTGEARFHDCLAACAQKLCLVLPGHFASERFGVEEIAGSLKGAFPEMEVWPSDQEKDPIQVL